MTTWKIYRGFDLRCKINGTVVWEGENFVGIYRSEDEAMTAIDLIKRAQREGNK
jgi:uncharacterized protein YegP (UPF0339 family)